MTTRPAVAAAVGAVFGAALTLAFVHARSTRSSDVEPKARLNDPKQDARKKESLVSLDPKSPGNYKSVAQHPDADSAGAELRRLRRVEAALRDRICDAVLVLERTSKSHNFTAMLRTAEAMGFQHVYLVSVQDSVSTYKDIDQRFEGAAEDNKSKALHCELGKKAFQWLTIHEFSTATEAIADLREKGFDIWVTDLSQKAVSLGYDRDSCALTVPDRCAFVVGTECSGISQTFVDAADQRVFLPMSGIADSFNVSVAAAMTMQQLIFLKPSLIGSISDEEKMELRTKWYKQMARNPKEEADFLSLLDNPPRPFRDTRRSDAHRQPRMLPSDIRGLAADGEVYAPGR